MLDSEKLCDIWLVQSFDSTADLNENRQWFIAFCSYDYPGKNIAFLAFTALLFTYFELYGISLVAQW